ncbi:RICIN domain-containing protein [Streptomyces sp. C]|uniref:RICIN domain-containing protein n=1 Tax=Streptomyces sp. C TaxID=253839 RepID=UPI0001B4DC8D|nr:RICIN domain-containing protein [Streptomyces sp. C]
MKRSGRLPGPLKGRTAEANALATFLRELTADWTGTQLAERYSLSPSVWSEYRSGLKIIPLPRLNKIIEDRYARDGRTRADKLRDARLLHTAATAAVLAASRTPAVSGSPTPAAYPTEPAHSAVVPAVVGPPVDSSAEADPQPSVPGPDATSTPAPTADPTADPAQATTVPAHVEGPPVEASGPRSDDSAPAGPPPSAPAAAPLSPAEAAAEPQPSSRPPAEAGTATPAEGLGPPKASRRPGRRRGHWRAPAQWAALAALVAVLVIANQSDPAKAPSDTAAPGELPDDRQITAPADPGLHTSPPPAPDPSATGPTTPVSPTPPVSTNPDQTPSEKASAPDATPPAAAPPAPPAAGEGRAEGSVGPLFIRNDRTGKCVDIPGLGGAVNGTPVNQYTCDTSTTDNQRFFVDFRGRTSSGWQIFTIRSAKVTNMCLDPVGVGRPGVNEPLQMWTCVPSAADNQRFYEQPLPGGRAWIVNEASGLCLDVAGLNAGNDARLQLYPCIDGPSDDHNWSLLAA